MESKSNQRIGEIEVNTFGSKMKIIKYNNAKDMVVEFENGYKTNAQYSDFKKGNVRNVYDRNLFNVGYLGEGIYKSKVNRKNTPQYNAWQNMLRRCYDESYQEKHPTYIGCEVVEEWHNFQNFAKWYDENYYEIEGQIMDLDKDILVIGNKIYSPETCLFVPQSINKLFTTRGKGKYVSERIKALAELYRDKIPTKLYNAMIANII